METDENMKITIEKCSSDANMKEGKLNNCVFCMRYSFNEPYFVTPHNIVQVMF